MERKWKMKWKLGLYRGCILGLYRENGKENGKYHSDTLRSKDPKNRVLGPKYHKRYIPKALLFRSLDP